MVDWYVHNSGNKKGKSGNEFLFCKKRGKGAGKPIISKAVKTMNKLRVGKYKQVDDSEYFLLPERTHEYVKQHVGTRPCIHESLDTELFGGHYGGSSVLYKGSVVNIIGECECGVQMFNVCESINTKYGYYSSLHDHCSTLNGSNGEVTGDDDMQCQLCAVDYGPEFVPHAGFATARYVAGCGHDACVACWNRTARILQPGNNNIQRCTTCPYCRQIVGLPNALLNDPCVVQLGLATYQQFYAAMFDRFRQRTPEDVILDPPEPVQVAPVLVEEPNNVPPDQPGVVMRLFSDLSQRVSAFLINCFVRVCNYFGYQLVVLFSVYFYYYFSGFLFGWIYTMDAFFGGVVEFIVTLLLMISMALYHIHWEARLMILHGSVPPADFDFALGPNGDGIEPPPAPAPGAPPVQNLTPLDRRFVPIYVKNSLLDLLFCWRFFCACLGDDIFLASIKVFFYCANYLSVYYTGYKCTPAIESYFSENQDFLFLKLTVCFIRTYTTVITISEFIEIVNNRGVKLYFGSVTHTVQSLYGYPLLGALDYLMLFVGLRSNHYLSPHRTYQNWTTVEVYPHLVKYLVNKRMSNKLHKDLFRWILGDINNHPESGRFDSTLKYYTALVAYQTIVVNTKAMESHEAEIKDGNIEQMHW